MDSCNLSITTMTIQGCHTKTEVVNTKGQAMHEVWTAVCVENVNSIALYIMHLLHFIVLPVVEDAMDHQPLHLDTIATDLLLHAGNKRVLVLPFGALIIITLPSEIDGRWLVHVSLPLVVTEHHLAIQLQLRVNGKEQIYEDTRRLYEDAFWSLQCTWSSSTHEQCQ